jgi:hypothetical protein
MNEAGGRYMLSGDELGTLTLMYAAVIVGSKPNGAEMAKFERLIQKQAVARRMKACEMQSIRNLLSEGIQRRSGR